MEGPNTYRDLIVPGTRFTHTNSQSHGVEEYGGGTMNGVNVLVERGGICKSYDCCFATAIAIALLFPKRIVLMTWLPRRMGISNGIRYVWLLLWRL